jgi:hypothetical protein
MPGEDPATDRVHPMDARAGPDMNVASTLGERQNRHYRE